MLILLFFLGNLNVQGQNSARIDSLIAAANLKINANQQAEAMKDLFEARKLAEFQKDTASLCTSLTSIASLTVHTNDSLEMRRAVKDGIYYCLISDDSTHVARLYMISGIMHYYMSQLDSSIFYFSQSADLYLAIDDSLASGNSLVKVGNIWELQGNYDLARAYYQKYLDLVTRAGTSYHKMNAHIYLAGNDLYLENWTSGLHHIDLAMQYALEADKPSEYMTILHYKSLFYNSMGRHKDAYDALEHYFTYFKDTFNIQERTQTLLALEAQYENEKKEATIANQMQLLKEENNLKRLYLAFGILAFLVAGILVHRIVYMRRIKNELNRQKQRAEESEKAKSRLFTNITHEFRTPLTVIQNVTDQLRYVTAVPDDSLKLIDRNSAKLLHLVQQILDLSKLEAHLVHLQLIQGDIIPILRGMVESFLSVAYSRDLELVIADDVEHLVMDYDPEKIQVVISNLVSNALKFTPQGGRIEVQLSSDTVKGTSLLYVNVIDTGLGIGPDEIPRIFDRFYQGDNVVTRAGHGTGIGMSYTRELIRLMGGDIEVESTQGKGTTFRFYLPVKNTAPFKEYQGISHLPGLASSLLEQVPILTSTDETGSFDADTPLLLIVEDQKDIILLISQSFDSHFRIVYALDGAEGLEKALSLIPDIIISDVMMPSMDGYQLCTALKSDHRTSHIPVILLTALAGTDSRITGLECGADVYLEKPFHRRELEAQIHSLLENRQRLHARYAAPSKNDSSIDTLGAPAFQLEDAFLVKLREMILLELTNTDFGIEETCKAMAMSRMGLHRKLKALTGLSTSIFIRNVRLQKAHELLMQGQLNVSEVAYSTGFENPKYFSRLFHEYYGFPPSKLNLHA